MKKVGKTKAKTRKISIIFVMLVVLMSVSAVLYATEPETTEIVCNDINLYDTLVEELDDYVYNSDRNTKVIKVVTTDISSITQLKLTGKSTAKITDLTGIENFTSLENLNLSGNNITNITPIAGLTTLKTLNMSGNESAISNIEELSSLTNLTNVNFASSKLTNVEFMRNYANLQVLDVSGNGISSLEPIQGVSSLLELNIANNGSFSRLADDIFCHETLIKLDISDTGVLDLEGIQYKLTNLETLKVRYLEIELDPIVATYKQEIEVDGEEETIILPYLDQLKVLDISYTTKSISFKQISYLSSLKDLYMIDVVGKWKNPETTSKLSLSGIYELQDLNYINLASNNIDDLEDIVYKKISNGVVVEFKCLGATEIYLNDNNIIDISPLASITKTIKILNLSYNAIPEIWPLSYCSFTSDREIDLRFQNMALNVYKKSSVDQYIIIPEIFQQSKNEGSIVYAENSDFITKCNNIVDDDSITLNKEEPYLQPEYYNVIIDKTKTKDDILTLELTGNGIASGSKITFKLGTSTSNVDSLLFRDPNLCSAIKEELAKPENADRVKYLANAHMIMNINNSAIKNIDVLDLSVEEIADLSGLENFTGLQNLNISGNLFTTIDPIQYCTKMVNLNVANNKIGDNNTAIQQMTKLEVLDLANTEMTQINSLKTLIDYWTTKKKFTLISLNLSGNGFTNADIKGIEKIITLTTLKVANNEITEIESFEPLKTTISIFDVSQNKIEDISKISSFTNLISLNLSNNKIKDISPVATCTRLNELDFSVNKVKDISSLTSISGTGTLVKLNMTNNQIEDVSAVDKAQINQLLLAENQKITKAISDEMEGIVTVNLPQIFTASRNSASRFYSEKDIKLSVVGKTESVDVSEYCTLSTDGTSLQVNADKLNNEIIIAKIQDGNADNTTLAIAAPLEGTITYNPSNEELTNQDITATITFNRTATITNNEGKNTYKFTQNGEFTFEYYDEYGFEGTATAKVTNIDKTAPQSTQILKEIVNKKVVVTIKVNEAINQPNGWTLADNKLSITKTYESDANETVKLVDLAGNETSVNVQVKIDKTAPVITGVENGKTYNKPVTPVIQDENLNSIKLTKDGVNVSNYQSGTTISETGEYVLTATDKFENTTTVSFKINVSDIITSKDEKVTVTEEELIIEDIAPETTSIGLKQKLQAEMEYKIIDKQGSEISDTSKIGTGYKIVLENNKTYILVVSGDCNSDGAANIKDILAINKHRLNKVKLTEEYLLAGDINKDGKADIRDILQINKFRLGKINEL